MMAQVKSSFKIAVKLDNIKKMNNKTKIVWRLSKLPSVEELQALVKDKIITQEEAREILFSLETEEDRDEKGLKSEIKFLRELVEKLSKDRSQIITTIREIEVPYRRYPWYNPYVTWCSNSDYSLNPLTTNTIATGGDTLSILGGITGNGATVAWSTDPFSNIKTF